MTLHKLVRLCRPVIDEYVRHRGCSKMRLNDKERIAWIRNDEDLYRWAKRLGVKRV